MARCVYVGKSCRAVGTKSTISANNTATTGSLQTINTPFWMKRLENNSSSRPCKLQAQQELPRSAELGLPRGVRAPGLLSSPRRQRCRTVQAGLGQQLLACLGGLLNWLAVAAALVAAVRVALWALARRGLREADLGVPEYSLEGVELPARVVKVYDGDTVHVVMRTGLLAPLRRYKVRLAGIDAPEIRSQDPEEKAAAAAARDRLAELVYSEGQIVRFRCGGFDKYGRLLGEIFADPWLGQADKSANAVLVEEGHAYAYDGGTKQAFAA
mmetsp:Transcript_6290/g.15102  ORF Transcript_6290/g.15102 Transcript_6290/m.15102 type:complete len:270 (+) Transcript_6290:171-980(+)